MVVLVAALFSGAVSALLLVIALSMDAFVASFAYGNNKIKIPFSSALVINFICTGSLALSLLLGAFIRPYIDANIAKTISFAVLFVLGMVKLFDSSIKSLIRRKQIVDKQWAFRALHLNFILHIYANPEEADKDASQCLSKAEAASLAVALSLDGLAVGFGAGLGLVNVPLVLVFSLLLHLLTISLGAYLGHKLAKKSAFDLSWLSGVLLIILAFTKLT